MDAETKYKLHKLRVYLDNLPDSLPFREEAESDYAFHYFGFGNSDEEDYGLEGAVNRQFEVRLGHRRDGPVGLKERGPGLSAVIIVLENYLTELPKSVILKKWVDDLILSAHQVFENAKHPVSCISVSPDLNCYLHCTMKLPIVPEHANPCPARAGPKSSSIWTIKPNNEPDAGDQTRTEHQALPRVRKQVPKVDSKVLSAFEDPACTDLPQKEDKRGRLSHYCSRSCCTVKRRPWNLKKTKSAQIVFGALARAAKVAPRHGLISGIDDTFSHIPRNVTGCPPSAAKLPSNKWPTRLLAGQSTRGQACVGRNSRLTRQLSLLKNGSHPPKR